MKTSTTNKSKIFKNEKTFQCIAKTKKGNLDVEVKVWTVNGFWKSSGFVVLNNEKIEISFNEHCDRSVYSYQLAQEMKTELPVPVYLKCDCRRIKKYIDNIKMEKITKSANAQRKFDHDRMIHDL